MYLFSPGNWLACIVKACAWLHVHCAQEHLINKNWSSSIFEDELSECVISARATRMRKSIFMSKCMFLDDLTAILRIKFFLCVFAYLQSNVVKIKTASNHYYIQKLMISKITKFQANEKICFLSCNSDQVIKHYLLFQEKSIFVSTNGMGDEVHFAWYCFRYQKSCRV